jgi:hypothetical protein
MNKKCPQCGSSLKHASSISRDICYQCGFSEERVEDQKTNSKPKNKIDIFPSIESLPTVVIVFSLFGFVCFLAMNLQQSSENIQNAQENIESEKMYQDYLEEERRLHERTLAMQRLESQMELTNHLLLNASKDYADAMNEQMKAIASMRNNRVIIGQSRQFAFNRALRQPIRTWASSGVCLCPYDQVAHDDFSTSLVYANRLQECGEISSYMRQGGEAPSCYVGDPNPSEAFDLVLECRAAIPDCYVVS